MKRLLVTGAVVAALVASSQAIAQTILIEPEQRTRIKEYVVKERVKPVTVRERVTVGATVPAEVELAPVPPAWGVAPNHRFFYWDDRVVLVEPSGRRVVHIID
jgi:Protein of unknown function (DUF1236)